MSFIKNLLRYLNPFGGVVAATDAANGAFKNLTSAFDSATDKIDSFINAQTGGVTARDEAMMQYQTQEREAAQNWTAQREDTEMQRRMADMKAAGINPMMAAGGGVSSPSQAQSAPSGANAASLSNIFQLATLGPQIDVLKAQAENLRSQAKNRDKLTPAQIEEIGQRIQESIAREREAWKKAEELDYKIQLDISETLLADAQAHFAEVSAQDLQALRESRIALNEARTQEAKASATLSYWNSMYQKGLISEGMCAKVAAKIAAETRLADKQGKLLDEQSTRQAIENSVKSGHWSTEISQEGNAWDKMLMYLDRATSTLGNVLSLHN